MAFGNLIVASKPWGSFANGILAALGFTIVSRAAIYLVMATKR